MIANSSDPKNCLVDFNFDKCERCQFRNVERKAIIFRREREIEKSEKEISLI